MISATFFLLHGALDGVLSYINEMDVTMNKRIVGIPIYIAAYTCKRNNEHSVNAHSI